MGLAGEVEIFGYQLDFFAVAALQIGVQQVLERLFHHDVVAFLARHLVWILACVVHDASFFYLTRIFAKKICYFNALIIFLQNLSF